MKIYEIVTELEKYNKGVTFWVNNDYNPRTSLPSIEVRGSFPRDLKLPPNMKVVENNIYYGEFRYHMVPLP